MQIKVFSERAKAMRKKDSGKGKNKLTFKSEWLMRFAAISIAFLVWLVVNITISPNTTFVINNVPVSIDTFGTATAELGLDVISADTQYVSITVNGNRQVVGGLTAEDIEVHTVLNNVVASGTHEVGLYAEPLSGLGEFEIININPSVLYVKFDRIVSRTFTIESNISGVSVPEGYIVKSPVLDNSEITITGPEGEVNKIDKVLIEASFTGEFTSSATSSAPIVLLDNLGNEIAQDDFTLSVSEVSLTVPILQKAFLNLEVSYNNIPSSINLEELPITLSATTIEVAGPSESIAQTDSINIGYIDMSKVSGGESFTFEVLLPSGYDNISNVSQVTASVSTNLYSESFRVTNINVINRPTNKEITTLTNSISNVVIVGPEEIIENIEAGDIVAEVDLSEITLASGENIVAAKIMINGYDNVWYNGEYTVNIRVSE